MEPIRKTTLRNIQLQGKKALKNAAVVMDRQGPMGVFIPADIDSLPRLQLMLRRFAALESLRAGWRAAESAHLDVWSDQEIASEIQKARRARKTRRS